MRFFRCLLWLLIWPLFVLAYVLGSLFTAPYFAHEDWRKGWYHMLGRRRKS